MQLFATSIAVVAGVCFGIGVLFLFIALRQPRNRTRNLLFALFSLAYGGAVVAARAGFFAETQEQYFNASRISGVIASIGFSLLIWFVAKSTGFGPRWVLWSLTAVFVVVGVGAAFFPDWALGTDGELRSITLPWGETLLVGPEATTSILALQSLGILGMVGYIGFANVVLFRRGARREAMVLAIGLGWFAFTLVEETLVVAGVVDWPFLSDFGFLGFVIAVGLSITNEAIETEAQLVELQSNLEMAVRERTVELAQAQASLVAQAEQQAAAAERSRLARELHDVVTQILFAINLIAGSLGRLWRTDPEAASRTTDELQRLTRGALAEMRILLRELRPESIARTDLGALVTQLADGLGARHDIPVEVSTRIHGSLPEAVHLAIYRIAQEATNNVAKHADASRLVIDLEGNYEGVRLRVEDDGEGFETGGVGGASMGLAIMRERACDVGAALEVASSPGEGTSVEVTWGEPDRLEPV